MAQTFKIPKNILVLAILVLLAKLLLLPFAQTDDPDAVSRILDAREWMYSPEWFITSYWPPFQYYLQGSFLMLWDNVVLCPKILNIILSILMLFPFYSFTKREFNENGAFAATVILSLCPILFRNSFLGLSETPFLLFVALSMNFVSKAIKENRVTNYVLGGISITIASGFRYEAWLIIFVLFLVIAVNKKLKGAAIFSFFALLFPVIWMAQHYAIDGNIFSFLRHNSSWVASIGSNSVPDLETYARRIWFYPFSLFIALGPAVFFLAFREIFRLYREKQKHWKLIIWSIPFWVLFLFFEINCFNGLLMTHHRLVGSLILFALPFSAPYFHDFGKQKIKLLILFILPTLGLTYVYNVSSITPLPRLETQLGEALTDAIQPNLNNKSSLIIPLIDWETTHFVLLHSGLRKKEIIVYNKGDKVWIPKQEIWNKLKQNPNGVLVLMKGSLLLNEFEAWKKAQNKTWENHIIFESEELIAYKWKRIIRLQIDS